MKKKLVLKVLYFTFSSLLLLDANASTPVNEENCKSSKMVEIAKAGESLKNSSKQYSDSFQKIIWDLNDLENNKLTNLEKCIAVNKMAANTIIARKHLKSLTEGNYPLVGTEFATNIKNELKQADVEFYNMSDKCLQSGNRYAESSEFLHIIKKVSKQLHEYHYVETMNLSEFNSQVSSNFEKHGRSCDRLNNRVCKPKGGAYVTPSFRDIASEGPHRSSGVISK